MAVARPGSSRGLSALDGLDIRDIPEDGLRFDEPLPETWLGPRLEDGQGLSWTPRGAGRVALEVTALGPVDQAPPIRIHGLITSEVETDCVRCLEPVHQALRAELDLTLFSEAGPSSSDAPGAELDEGRYEGGRIPLPEMIREVLLLELDMNPTCEEAGACDARTARLIEEANRPARAMEAEEAAKVDPRWAPLAKLKTRGSD